MGPTSTSLSPTLVAIGVALLGSGGIAGVLTALASRRNYVTTAYRSLTDASAAEAASERAARLAAEASCEAMKTARDRWRDAYYSVRFEAAAAGVALRTPPPIDPPLPVPAIPPQAAPPPAETTPA